MSGSIALSKVSVYDPESLRHLTDLLHLFHHRNKNQHRRSIWWRHFSLFRKNLDRVTKSLQRLNETPTTHVGRTKKKAENQQILASLEQRLLVWRDVLVPKWQHTFSQVVADGRFSVLGLVLLSTLAEACAILKVTAAFEDLGQAEVEKVLERFAQERWEESEEDAVVDEGRPGLEDFGEVIRRDDEVESAPSAAIPTVKTTAENDLSPARSLMPAPKGVKRSTSRSATKVAKKKRRKGGDAIDDLFSGLG